MAPLNDPELFVGGDYGSYIFCGGRINAAKATTPLGRSNEIHAKQRQVSGGGARRHASRRNSSIGLVERYNLKDRVCLDLGFLPRERIAKYVNEAFACAYLPVDEDSVGYVTMEAFSAAKSVLTVSDSGGLLDIIRDGDTGLVVRPETESLAAAIDRLANNRNITIEMGKEGRARWTGMNVTWSATIERLLA